MISVCIPTYNQENYIAQTIQSVLAQSLKADEIIISNDASTDKTKIILDDLAAKTDNLCIIHQPVNLGMSKNTDACLRAAEGDIIVKLDSDDLLLPDYIKELYTLLSKHPNAGYAHGNVNEIDGSGKIVKIRSVFRTSIFQSSEDALQSLLKGYRVAANIIMFRKEALEKAGYIQSNKNFAEDFFLSVAIADKGYGNVFCNKVLSCYRVWADTGFVRQKRKLAEIKGLTYVFEEGLMPAFIKRQWNTRAVEKAKEKFACAQADCLSWPIYTTPEKEELKQAVLQLSDSKKVKSYIWAYENGFDALLTINKKIIGFVKQLIKKVAS